MTSQRLRLVQRFQLLDLLLKTMREIKDLGIESFVKSLFFLLKRVFQSTYLALELSLLLSDEFLGLLFLSFDLLVFEDDSLLHVFDGFVVLLLF